MASPGQTSMNTYPGRDHFTQAEARARTSDPATSHVAAAMVDAEGQRGKIMDVLGLTSMGLRKREVGWTADELDNYIGWRVTTAGRRLSELKRRGLVEPCGERLTRSGRPATAYRAVA